MRSRLRQRLRSRRALNKRNPLYCKLDPSSLAHGTLGLALTLLVTLMTVPSAHPGSWADLPRLDRPIRMPNANRDDAIRIVVARDGAIYFQKRKHLANDLPQQIRDYVKHGAECKVYLDVDWRARYGDVEPVLDQIRASGIRNITLLAEPR
jgi:biopolymer transport protein ExbD